MKNLFLLLIATTFLFSCDNTQRHRKSADVKVYKVANSSTVDNNDWIWYYMIFNQNGSYYYYSSPVYYTSIPSSATWASSTTTPINPEYVSTIDQSQPIAEFNEPMTELPDEIEVEMDNTEQAQSETESAAENSNSESNSESSSSSDGGSSDSGGGSDGGGGGE